MWGPTGDTSQDMIQLVILLVSVICIPIMLFPKPIIEIQKNKRIKKQYPLGYQNLEEDMDLSQKLNPSEDSLAKKEP